MTTIPEILLIEDSEDDRLLFKRAVEHSGLHVQMNFARDAAQAIIRLNQIGEFAGLPLPHLIVLDLNLPWLQGKTILQILRDTYGNATVPIVVLSGTTNAHDRSECESFGISDFIQKPNSFDDLVRIVSSFARFLPSPNA